MKETKTITDGIVEAVADLTTTTTQENIDDRRRKLRMEDLRRVWNAPHRHSCFIPEATGEWADKIAWFETQMRSGVGMLGALCGERGTGKTQLAIELMKFVTQHGRTAYYTTVVEFFCELKETFKSGSNHSEKDIIERYRKPRFLVLDEIGKRCDSQWAQTLLFELINWRYNDMTDTLLLSNRLAKDQVNKETGEKEDGLITILGPSLVRRLNETGGIAEMTKGYK